MKVILVRPRKPLAGTIELPASKSISNRMLIIQKLMRGQLDLANLSEANDTVILDSILNEVEQGVWNVEDAGTCCRFLIALGAITPGVRTITGTSRMLNRPIGILVDALRSLGAEIDYIDKEGYLPLKISGNQLLGGTAVMDGSISSQFTSALMLIAPQLRKGLNIQMTGTISSAPYLELTAKCMRSCNAEVTIDKPWVMVEPTPYHLKNQCKLFEIEGDWSAAPNYFGFAALNPGSNITLKGLFSNSWQGDSIVEKLYSELGFCQFMHRNHLHCAHQSGARPESFSFDFTDFPDLAQPLIVLLALNKINGEFQGLESLKIKETDRVAALSKELAKVNITFTEENQVWKLDSSQLKTSLDSVEFDSYNDHRMAMAFAQFACVYQKITINQAEVVRKSNPNFWQHLSSLGLEIEVIDN